MFRENTLHLRHPSLSIVRALRWPRRLGSKQREPSERAMQALMTAGAEPLVRGRAKYKGVANVSGPHVEADIVVGLDGVRIHDASSGRALLTTSLDKISR